MNKILFSIALLASAAASAQVTLTQASFASASLRGADTLLSTDTVTRPVFPPSVAGATNFMYDFSGATSKTNVSILYRVAGTGSSNFADSVIQSFPSLASYSYTANLQSSVTSAGYFETGFHVSRAGIPLHGLNSNALVTDSIIVTTQDVVFSSNRTEIAFPASVNSAWSSSFMFDLDFLFNYGGIYINTPGFVRTYITEKDTVLGYGKVKVKDIDGNGSGYMDVLQVQSITKTVDSFYLNGALAPASFLPAPLVQGYTYTSNEQYYYRAGEFTPLAHITFDSTNTTPKSAETQAVRLLSSFIPETEYTKTLNVFPNPVTDHTIIVSGAPANYGNWSYELENVAGQVVTKGALQLNANNTKISISLSATTAPGTYFLHLYNNASQQTVRTLTIK